jgi:hypothetical protein
MSSTAIGRFWGVSGREDMDNRILLSRAARAARGPWR